MKSRADGQVGWIHITHCLIVPANTGCHLFSDCLNCPMPKCYLDMTVKEKSFLTRQRNKEHASTTIANR